MIGKKVNTVLKTTLLATTLTASLLTATQANAAGELKVFNWSDYIPLTLLDKFAAEYDVKVTLDSYDSNETLLAKLKSGVTGYDVAVPGDYMVAIMIKEGLLEKVEPNQLSNFKNMKQEMIDVPFDAGRHYSIPYQFGTTAFMVDTDVYQGDIDTLEILFNPPEVLKGKINMFRDVNDVINAALRYKGFETCNSNRKELKEVNDMLMDARQHWLSMTSDGAKEMVVSGDAAVSMVWNGMALRARMEKPSIQYAYPKQNMTAWADSLVVLKGAKNMDNAKLFMNFLLDPENAAALTNYAGYTAGVEGTEPYLEDKFKGAHELNRPANAPIPEFVPPCDAKVIKLYDRLWTNMLK